MAAGAALLLLFAVQAASTCVTDLDCELLGTCEAGACRCAPGFIGPTCGALDLKPVPAATLGRVWPADGAPASTLAWSFAPMRDDKTQRYHAVVEVGCGPVWMAGNQFFAVLSSDRPDGGFTFTKRFADGGATSPHFTRLPNGSVALVFNACRVNHTVVGPVCTGNATPPAAGDPALHDPLVRACQAGEDPTNTSCLWSGLGGQEHWVYTALADTFPDGPYKVRGYDVTGPGWSPYNATLKSIGMSNPSALVTQDGEVMMNIRSHGGVWPGVTGEHTGFAKGPTVFGPFTVQSNLSWQHGNDEDGFLWQQRDGTYHMLYHNGRGNTPGTGNHGLHAFSRDGVVWHKPAGALTPACYVEGHCTSMYTNSVTLNNGTAVLLGGRERPALLFDRVTGAPTHLYNGAIPPPGAGRNWYSMVQVIGSA